MANWCTTYITINYNDKGKLKAFYEMLDDWRQKPIAKNDFDGMSLGWLGNIVGNSGIAKYNEKESVFVPDIPCRGSLLSLDYHDEKIEITTETAWDPLLEMWNILCDKYLPDAEILYIAKESDSGFYCSNDPDVIGKYDIWIWGDPPEGFEDEEFDDAVSEEKTIEFLQRVFDTDEKDIDVLLEQIEDIEDPWFSVNKYESLDNSETKDSEDFDDSKDSENSEDSPDILVKDHVVVKCLNHSVTSVVIPEGITKISKEAFCDCDSLKSVVIPEGVTKIGDSAFRDCPSLSSIVIPKSVTEIDDAAFKGCHSLKSVEIPEGVTKIGACAFNFCESLSSVVIPEGVTIIRDMTFNDCKSLKSVVIPESVREIDMFAFDGCYSLKLVEFGGTMAQWEDVKNRHYLSSSIVMCSDGKWQKPALTIENEVLVACCDQSITSVVIPECVTEIGDSAFLGCKSLTSVEFGGTMAQWEAVKGTVNLWNYVPASIVKCSDGECKSPVLLVKNGVLVECCNKSVANVGIPEGVTEIGDGVFRNFTSLKSVIIPASVTKIGEGAFKGCKSLKSVVISASITEIGMSAFLDCKSLTSVEFAGTMAQWAAIKKCKNWQRGVPTTVVKCSDGKAKL